MIYIYILSLSDLILIMEMLPFGQTYNKSFHKSLEFLIAMLH